VGEIGADKGGVACDKEGRRGRKTVTREKDGGVAHSRAR
jgi:hypothetical protein